MEFSFIAARRQIPRRLSGLAFWRGDGSLVDGCAGGTLIGAAAVKILLALSSLMLLSKCRIASRVN